MFLYYFIERGKTVSVLKVVNHIEEKFHVFVNQRNLLLIIA